MFHCLVSVVVICQPTFAHESLLCDIVMSTIVLAAIRRASRLPFPWDGQCFIIKSALLRIPQIPNPHRLHQRVQVDWSQIELASFNLYVPCCVFNDEMRVVALTQ